MHTCHVCLTTNKLALYVCVCVFFSSLSLNWLHFDFTNWFNHRVIGNVNPCTISYTSVFEKVSPKLQYTRESESIEYFREKTKQSYVAITVYIFLHSSIPCPPHVIRARITTIFKPSLLATHYQKLNLRRYRTINRWLNSATFVCSCVLLHFTCWCRDH